MDNLLASLRRKIRYFRYGVLLNTTMFSFEHNRKIMTNTVWKFRMNFDQKPQLSPVKYPVYTGLYLHSLRLWYILRTCVVQRCQFLKAFQNSKKTHNTSERTSTHQIPRIHETAETFQSPLKPPHNFQIKSCLPTSSLRANIFLDAITRKIENSAWKKITRSPSG